ncbi:MAG: hypothetical protein ACRC2H_09630 [Silanimonas sp.]
MSALFPETTRRNVAPVASAEAVDAARRSVRELLESSESFGALPPDERREMANNLVKISTYLAEPDGQRVPAKAMGSDVQALAAQGFSRRPRSVQSSSGDAKFSAQAGREGAAVAGALLEQVNFVEFVSGLINGVFHSIIDASIRQMEATAKLVADVAKTLNQFRDDNTTANQGRDHLIEQFPNLFKLALPDDEFDFGGDEEGGRPKEPRVRLREGVDEQAAVQQLNNALPLQQPITRIDDNLIEALLVPAARTQIATGRQQLLATLVTLGINRIVVTDGKISAKVMYEFKARDNMRFRQSAQHFDYSDKVARTWEGEQETDIQGGSRSRSSDGSSERNDGSYYSKGTYKATEQPLLTMQSATSTALDANLETKAKLAGEVHVNFKSDYLPLDKVANPAMMAQLQMNAQPGMLENLAKNRPSVPGAAPGGTTPATTPAPTPAA